MLGEARESELGLYAQVKPMGSPDFLQARWNAHVAGEHIWVVWREQGTPLGWAVLRIQGRPTAAGYPDLSDLWVMAGQRGRGIGTAILAGCEELVAARGFTRLGLAVNPGLNPRALALYTRFGYYPTGGPTYLDGVYDGDEDWVIDLVKDLIAR